jgi:hypothetical protein
MNSLRNFVVDGITWVRAKGAQESYHTVASTSISLESFFAITINHSISLPTSKFDGNGKKYSLEM